MPTYTYQCSCGVRFEGRASVASRNKPKSCPDCGKGAALMPPPSVSGQFKKEVTGPGPQNTGVHDLDTHIDRVIGQHAEQGWEVARGRYQMKRQVMAAQGVDGNHLRKNPDGSYGVINPEEKAVQQRALKIQERAYQWQKSDR